MLLCLRVAFVLGFGQDVVSVLYDGNIFSRYWGGYINGKIS